MCNLKFVFLQIILYSSIETSSSFFENDHNCNQINACECVFNDGKGISLYGLNIIEYGCNNSLKIIFHPCTNMNMNKSFSNDTAVLNECQGGTSICLVIVSMINLGTWDKLKFQTVRDTGDVYLISEYNEWTTKINLQCNGSSNTTKLNATDIDVDNMKLTLFLNSPKACLNRNLRSVKLGEASIALIVICAFLFIYFIGGALLLKFVYDADGVEMIPHRRLWIGLFEYLRTFALYCANGCKSASGYEEI